MIQKLILLVSSFFYFSAVPTFAHGIGEAEKTASSISVWVYIFSSFVLVGLIGYAYAFYLKKRLNKNNLVKTQKEIRLIKQQLDKKRRQVIKLSTVIVAVGFIVGIVWMVSEPEKGGIDRLQSNVNIEVETFPAEGVDHIKPNDPTPSYKTFPPTSGPHSPQTFDYGYYENPLPFELLVHNLEHGDIVIYYKPTLSEEAKDHLKYLSKFTMMGSGVIVVPSDQIEGEVTATAWTKRMTLSSFDEEKVGKFIYEFIYQGPEKLPPRN
jgi:hypothetical protein